MVNMKPGKVLSLLYIFGYFVDKTKQNTKGGYVCSRKEPTEVLVAIVSFMHSQLA